MEYCNDNWFYKTEPISIYYKQRHKLKVKKTPKSRFYPKHINSLTQYIDLVINETYEMIIN